MLSRSFSPDKKGLIIAIASAMIFGVYPSAIRAVYADGGNMVLILLAMTWSRGLSMAGFCILKGHPLFQTRRDIKLAISGGFFQALSVIALYKSLEYIPAPIALIILFTHALMLLLFMAWRGEAKLDQLTVITTLTALVGLSFVLDIWHTPSSSSLLGFALAFVAALAAVSRLYVYGKQMTARHPIVVGAENFLSAALFTLFVLFTDAPQLPTHVASYGWMLLGCVAICLGTFGQFYGISLMGSFKWSLYLKMEPIFTSLFSVLLLGEVLHLSQYTGMLIVLGSLTIFQIIEHRRKKL